MSLNMNKRAVKLVSEVIERSKELRVEVLKIGGATVVDMGIKVSGSIEAGIYLSKICTGGLAEVRITSFRVGDLVLPAVEVSTDYPIEACMASQFAGWKVKVGSYFAMGSGPARALAKKPKKLYEEIGYEESSDEAVLVLETNELPNEEVIKYVAEHTGVKPEGIYIVAAPTNSLAGTVQVSARVVETGIHKLHEIGFNIKKILYGFGVAPIAPLHPDPLIMLGRTNDMILYGGETFYVVDYESDEELEKFVSEAPSEASKDYGKSLAEKVRELGIEFLYKVDPKVFAPAVVTVNNIRTGTTIRRGKLNPDVIKASISLR